MSPRGHLCVWGFGFIEVCGAIAKGDDAACAARILIPAKSLTKQTPPQSSKEHREAAAALFVLLHYASFGNFLQFKHSDRKF